MDINLKEYLKEERVMDEFEDEELECDELIKSITKDYMNDLPYDEIMEKYKLQSVPQIGIFVRWYVDAVTKLRNKRNIKPKFHLEEFLKHIKPNNDVEEEHCNYDRCKECGGKCCKFLGCCISPDDLIKVDYDTIRALLDSGCVSIDCWKGHRPIYFLRMRNINGKEIDRSWGGACTLWDENGCPLDFKHRPKGARKLIPSEEDEQCKEGYGKKQCKEDWKRYQKLLRKVMNGYKEDRLKWDRG